MKKILVVDDDPQVCSLLEVFLKKAGYDVIKSLNAEDGLKLALEEKPDLILSDYMMPGQNGEEFCRSVRNIKEISSTPFILITAKGTHDLRTKGLSNLFDDYLEKPLNISFLVAKVNAILRRQKEMKEESKRKTKKLWTVLVSLTLSIIATGFILLLCLIVFFRI